MTCVGASDDAEMVTVLSDESSCELPPIQLDGPCTVVQGERTESAPIALVDLTACESPVPPDHLHHHALLSSACEGVGEECWYAEQMPDSDRAFDLIQSTVTAPATSTATSSSLNRNHNHTSKNVRRRQQGEGEREGEVQDKRSRVVLDRAYRPTECMKHMVVEVSDEMYSSWLMSDTARELAGAGCTLRPIAGTPADPAAVRPHGLVTFLRRVPHRPEERSGRGVLVVQEEEVTALVSRRQLSQHATYASLSLALTVTLLIFLPHDYFKKGGRKQRVSEVDLEMALADVAVSCDGDAAVVRTPAELALFLLRYTRAVAEMPYKSRRQAADERADVYVRADSRQCVTVDSDGRGLGQLWQQMLSVLPQSSLETARAIRERYGTPRALAQECSTAEGRARAACTGVVRAAGDDARARSLGPDFARKLAALLTADCGDALLV